MALREPMRLAFFASGPKTGKMGHVGHVTRLAGRKRCVDNQLRTCYRPRVTWPTWPRGKVTRRKAARGQGTRGQRIGGRSTERRGAASGPARPGELQHPGDFLQEGAGVRKRFLARLERKRGSVWV